MGTRYMNTSSKIEANNLKVVFKYMQQNNLNHDTLMQEIKEKKCGLPCAIREYLILRDFLGKRILIDASKKD